MTVIYCALRHASRRGQYLAGRRHYALQRGETSTAISQKESSVVDIIKALLRYTAELRLQNDWKPVEQELWKRWRTRCRRPTAFPPLCYLRLLHSVCKDVEEELGHVPSAQKVE